VTTVNGWSVTGSLKDDPGAAKAAVMTARHVPTRNAEVFTLIAPLFP
jgi:hypothetical protein